jgi:hypothetical protein
VSSERYHRFGQITPCRLTEDDQIVGLGDIDEKMDDRVAEGDDR